MIAASTPLVRRVCLWCALALAGSLSGCALNPVSGTPDFVMMTEAKEIQLGRASDPKVRAQYGVYDDAALQTYVQQVGERVARSSHRPDLVYRFTVIDTPDVNAFALPGGYVYITRGILAYLSSEAELAAVLGHEVGHVTARHSVRQYSAATAGQMVATIFLGNAGQNLFNVIGGALLSGYGRDHELEADRLGAEYLARNAYDPDAMISVIGVLKNQEEFEKERAKTEGREPRNYHGVFASHPSADQRLQEVVTEAKQAKTASTTRIGRDEYLQHIDGLRYGDSPKAGVRRKSAFYHRDMNLAVQFPEGWQVGNAPSAVTAQSQGGDAVLQLRSADLNKPVAPEEYLKALLKVDYLQDAAALAGTSLPSYSGIARMATPFGRGKTRASVVYHENRAFLFLAAAKTDAAFARYDQQFLATARSLRALNPEEKPIAEGLQVRTVRAGAGDTFATLGAKSPLPNDAESVLRLINNKFPTGEPEAGETLKTIQ